ncbi:MAG: sigma-70 family RNA polymerase sigma factor [Dehalococcoidia bacterium]|nr:sigma-70 family RNA polymerase sigma factor [Dehalococcoidia bacterium]
MLLTEPGTDDASLIAAYRSGDDEALTALIQRHQTSVYRLAVGVLASHEEAEDAAQDALMSMLTSLHRFRGEARFSTWLYRLTLNICLKRRRSRGARLEAAEAADAPDGPQARPDVQAGRRWAQRQVARFLAALPYHYRMPVVLADCLNLTAPEIAELMQISLPAVKARLRRGRQRLREEIERYCRDAGLSGWRELVSEL